MSDFVIRSAVPQDAAALAACIDAAYARFKGHIPDLPEVSEGLVETIGSQPVLVAETEAEIVGGLVLALKGTIASLENVAVHPRHAGRGIARALIARAEIQARGAGAREFVLTTHARMPDNVRLYEHLGWTETARTDTKVTMNKSL